MVSSDRVVCKAVVNILIQSCMPCSFTHVRELSADTIAFSTVDTLGALPSDNSSGVSVSTKALKCQSYFRRNGKYGKALVSSP